MPSPLSGLIGKGVDPGVRSRLESLSRLASDPVRFPKYSELNRPAAGASMGGIPVWVHREGKADTLEICMSDAKGTWKWVVYASAQL